MKNELAQVFSLSRKKFIYNKIYTQY